MLKTTPTCPIRSVRVVEHECIHCCSHASLALHAVSQRVDIVHIFARATTSFSVPASTAAAAAASPVAVPSTSTLSDRWWSHKREIDCDLLFEEFGSICALDCSIRFVECGVFDEDVALV